MRDNIFKLVAHDTCKQCGAPIDLRFYGSDTGYELFCFFKETKTLKYNKPFYTRSSRTSFVKTCKACHKNTRNTTCKARRLREMSGKVLYPLKRAKTIDEITDMWNEFKNKVKDKKWLINAYKYLWWNGDGIMWHYYFMDIYQYFHSDDEFFDVYDLEEYDVFRC